jgi:hypothetical protein
VNVDCVEKTSLEEDSERQAVLVLKWEALVIRCHHRIIYTELPV